MRAFCSLLWTLKKESGELIRLNEEFLMGGEIKPSCNRTLHERTVKILPLAFPRAASAPDQKFAEGHKNSSPSVKFTAALISRNKTD